MMLRILFCDDDAVFLNYLKERMEKILSGMNVKTETAVCSSGEELITELTGSGADVVFLDIDMPGMSGFEAAETLRDLPGQPVILFVTGMDNLVYDSFTYRPFWFLRKTDLGRLPEVTEKLIRYFKDRERFFCFESGGQKVRLPVKEILYFESRDHDLTVYSQQGTWKYRERIAGVEERLQHYGFVRCHASFLVNCRHIALVNKGEIRLRQEQTVPVSRNRQKETEKKFMEYMRRIRL